ncbi:hypothetical protein EWM64_g3919 [Hericium alpestre]|uniref:Uncharacterized protein n=2 Tax=Hericium alpestre TaxID=135208 RepID=A0A4Z0A041_9AGAM|nr:hypothetical protein EWM64_g3919 [Hericium alpestre]
MLRKIAMVPYGESREVLMQEEPICAIVDAARYYVAQVTSKFTRKADKFELSIVDFEYAAYLQEVGPVLCDMYRNAISPALRPFLLGRVWHEIVKLVIVWRKAPFLATVVYGLKLCLEQATAIGGLAFTMEWPARSSPQERTDAGIKSIVDIEEMRPFLKLCDDELAIFLDPEDALDRLPTITVQDFLSDGVLSQTLSLIQVLSDDPHFCKYCVKIVRLAKQCIGLFLSEDEEARFVGPEVMKKA